MNTHDEIRALGVQEILSEISASIKPFRALFQLEQRLPALLTAERLLHEVESQRALIEDQLRHHKAESAAVDEDLKKVALAQEVADLEKQRADFEAAITDAKRTLAVVQAQQKDAEERVKAADKHLAELGLLASRRTS